MTSLTTGRKLLICMFAALTALAVTGGMTSAQDVWSADGSRISMKQGEARFIRLPKPAASVFLSDPAVADVDLQSAKYIYLVARSAGEATLFALDAEDEPMLRTTITVGVDTAMLTQAARGAIGRGTVSVSTVNGAIFLNGTVLNADDARAAEEVVGSLTNGAKVVNRLKFDAARQVNLQVKIAEVSRQVSQDLGISLSATSGNGRRSFVAPGTGVSNGFGISIQNGSGSVNLALDALAQNGLATILSQPNLTARSGEAATFLAGGQIPYRVGSTADDTRVEMQPIGVELEFTPTVRDSSQIEMKISTRVREIDQSRTTDADSPALSERSATTTVEIGSGQSFAIAGMFQANTQQSLSGLPGLVNLPIIGALFRSSKYARGETEMVIIVTPYVVSPTDGKNLTTPVDGFRPANGLEQSVMGRFEKAPREGGRVRGGAGFMMQ